MRVFVTGATGYFGGHLLDALLKSNHGVTALARGDAAAARMRARGVLPAAGDVTRPEGLADLIRGVDAVIHLVGIIREPRGATFQTIHVDGTRNVVEATRAAGVRRYLHMSALGTRPDAASRYHQTKFAAEEIVRASGLSHTIFRPSVMFGAGDPFTAQLKKFFDNPFFLPVIGPGTAKLQPVYVGDVARMFVDALINPAAENRVFEAGGPKAYAFDELLDVVGEHIGKKRMKLHFPAGLMRTVATVFELVSPAPPVTRDQITMLLEDNVCDPAPAAETFGISLTSFEEGIQRFL